jgi:hypothetical protein
MCRQEFSWIGLLATCARNQHMVALLVPVGWENALFENFKAGIAFLGQ